MDFAIATKLLLGLASLALSFALIYYLQRGGGDNFPAWSIWLFVATFGLFGWGRICMAAAMVVGAEMYGICSALDFAAAVMLVANALTFPRAVQIVTQRPTYRELEQIVAELRHAESEVAQVVVQPDVLSSLQDRLHSVTLKLDAFLHREQNEV